MRNGMFRSMLGGVVQRTPASAMPMESRFDSINRGARKRFGGGVRMDTGGAPSGTGGTAVDDVAAEVETDDTKGRATADLIKDRKEARERGKAIVDALGDDGIPDKDQRKSLREAAASVELLDRVIGVRQLDQSAIDRIKQAQRSEEERELLIRAGARPDMYGQPAGEQVTRLRSPGELFVESEQYEEFKGRYPSGIPEGIAVQADPVLVKGFRQMLGMFTATEKIAGRAPGIVTAADTSAGDLIRPQYLGLLEGALQRPLTVRDLVTVIPTESDAIEYVKETSREAASAIVDEATSSSGASGLKPEGGLIFDVVSTTVKTIAVWVAATKRVLADAPQLREYINSYLLDDLALELEDQMMAGSGAGSNFTGILNAGIQTQAAPGGGESNFDVIRKAITKVEINGRTRATAVVVHPNDSEKIDLLKVNNEVNHFAGAGPFADSRQPIWGLRRVESEAVPAGTAVVGDFKRAVLFDREAATVTAGTANDDFIRNILRLLAELRAGFGVLRPNAFCKVTLT